MLTNTAVQAPMAVQPLGGGPVRRTKGPAILDPQNDMAMMGPRSAGPALPEPQTMQATATPMPKPALGGLPTAGESLQQTATPMPKPMMPGGQPAGSGRQAKPNIAGPMPQPPGQQFLPPQISAPGAPNYQAQTPSLPGLPTPGQNNVQAPSVNAVAANAGKFNVDAFRPFADAVYDESTRQLDPMFQQREADFRQRMVNQGIAEGSEAYDKAFANFSRERNDAYGSARNQALAQALGAQNQFFGQSATNAQMQNQMGQFNAANSLQAQGMNLQDRNSLLGLGLQAQGMGMQDRQFGANLGLQYGQLGQQAQSQNASNWLQAMGLGEGARQFNNNLGFQFAGLGENARQFDQNFGFGRERADMQDLMALLGYGQQTTAYNNTLLGQDQQRAGSLFGLIPGLAPTQLDVMGAANMWNNQYMQGRQLQQDARNGMYQALGQVGGAMLMSDARLKTDISRVGTLDNGLPVYAFRYKAGGPMQIGLMAQDVLEVRPSAVGEVDGFLAVNYAEAVQ